jgi:hypothetical protein
MMLSFQGASEEPSIEVIPGPETAHPGQVWNVRIEVSWNGEPGAYAVMPATFEPVPWGTVTVESVLSYVQDGRNVVAQVIAVVPDQEGVLTLPRMDIAYQSPDTLPTRESGGEPVPPSGPEFFPQLRVEPLTLRVTPDRTLHWIFAGVGALFILLAAYMLARRRARRRQPGGATPSASPGAAAREALRAARERRVQGDLYGYYQELSRAADAVPGVADTLRERLQARAREVGFRNANPGPDMLDGDMKDVEQACRAADSAAPGAMSGGKTA